MFYRQDYYDLRGVYFLGDSPSKHDVARTVSGRKVNRKKVLLKSGRFFGALLAFWTLSPLLWWFSLSNIDSEGNTPPGAIGVLAVLAAVFAILGTGAAVAGAIIALIEGTFGDRWSQMKTLLGTNLASQRDRCVVITYDRSMDHLYDGPASMKALIGALDEREVKHVAMKALYDSSEIGVAIKQHVDPFLVATIKADALLSSDSLSSEIRDNLQASLDGLAALCADKISGIITKGDEEAALRLQEAADEDELQAIQETVKLAEQLKVDAMLALSDRHVASLGVPVLPQ